MWRSSRKRLNSDASESVRESLSHDAFDVGELLLGIDAHHFLHLHTAFGDNLAVHVSQDLGAVGQVVFLLGVFGFHAEQGFKECRAIEGETARVDFADLLLLGSRILLFNDSKELAIVAADNATEALVGVGPRRSDNTGCLLSALGIDQCS